MLLTEIGHNNGYYVSLLFIWIGVHRNGVFSRIFEFVFWMNFQEKFGILLSINKLTDFRGMQGIRQIGYLKLKEYIQIALLESLFLV